MDEMNMNLRLTYKIKEDEVVSTLDKMDKLQGSNKKQQLIFAAIMAIAAVDAYMFISTKNGFALILTMIFLVLGVFYKKKSNFSNRRLAEAFAADPQQMEQDLQELARAMKLLQMDYLGGHGSRGSGRVSLKNFRVSSFGEKVDCEALNRLFDEVAEYELFAVSTEI